MLATTSTSGPFRKRNKRWAVSICWECAKDWSVYAITRRALPAAALAVLISATVPVTHSEQSGVQVHLDYLDKQVDRLSEVPAKIAAISEELRQMRDEERQNHEKTNSIEVGIVVGLSVMMLEMFTRALGLRIGKADKNE